LKKLMILLSGADSLTRAEDFARKFKSQEKETDIVLLFVVDDQVPAAVSSWLIYVGFMGDKPSEDYRHTILKEFRRRAQEDLDELKGKLEAAGVVCRTRLEEGALVETLRRVVAEENADLLALALPGKSEVGAALYQEAAKELHKQPPCVIHLL
jgi:nucleotide-binding universal stress UspA family protein